MTFFYRILCNFTKNLIYVIFYFKYGKKNTGKDIPENINEKLEESLNLEMKELGYL